MEKDCLFDADLNPNGKGLSIRCGFKPLTTLYIRKDLKLVQPRSNPLLYTILVVRVFRTKNLLFKFQLPPLP